MLVTQAQDKTLCIGRENITVHFAYIHTVHKVYMYVCRSEQDSISTEHRTKQCTYVPRTGEYGTVYVNK